MSALSVAWWGLLALWGAFEVALLVRQRGGGERDRGSLAILWIAISAALTLGNWWGATHDRAHWTASVWLDALVFALFFGGLWLRWAAIRALGERFTVNVSVALVQVIETEGVYRLVRHPSYSGLLLIVFAVGLHTRVWIAFAIIFLPVLAALLYRIRVEEAALLQVLGREYKQYSKRTKRLVPGLY